MFSMGDTVEQYDKHIKFRNFQAFRALKQCFLLALRTRVSGTHRISQGRLPCDHGQHRPPGAEHDNQHVNFRWGCSGHGILSGAVAQVTKVLSLSTFEVEIDMLDVDTDVETHMRLTNTY
eukprot:3381584-Rhodomonas_salina.3